MANFVEGAFGQLSPLDCSRFAAGDSFRLLLAHCLAAGRQSQPGIGAGAYLPHRDTTAAPLCFLCVVSQPSCGVLFHVPLRLPLPRDVDHALGATLGANMPVVCILGATILHTGLQSVGWLITDRNTACVCTRGRVPS